MMPFDLIRDPMSRTMRNLEIVDSLTKNKHVIDELIRIGQLNPTPTPDEQGPFEVTQLINSFLGALAHPWERYKPTLGEISIPDAKKQGWPILKKDRKEDSDPENLGKLIGFIRHSFAHGNIEYIADDQNVITGLRFENIWRGKRIWGSTATIEQLRKFLEQFVELAKQLPPPS